MSHKTPADIAESVIHEYENGIGPTVLAVKTGLGRATIYRILNDARSQNLIGSVRITRDARSLNLIGGFQMGRRKSSRVYRTAIHKVLGTEFHIVGARVCELGNCFCVRGAYDDSRERMFLVEMFDTKGFPFVERESLFLTLIKTEPRRQKNKSVKEKAEENRRHAAAWRREDDAGEIQEIEELRIEITRDREYLPDIGAEPEVEDAKASEIISSEDSFHMESLPEEQEDFESEEIAAD